MIRILLFFALVSCAFSESFDETYARFATSANIDSMLESVVNEEYLLEMLESQLIFNNVKVAKKARNELSKIISDTLKEAKPEFSAKMREFYQNHFTQEDLGALADFYGTELGKKLVKSNIALNKDAPRIGAEIMARFYPSMVEKIERLLNTRDLN